MSSTFYLLDSENKAKKLALSSEYGNIKPESDPENEPEPRIIIEPDSINQLPNNPIEEPEGLLPPANSDDPNSLEPKGE